MGEWKNNLAEHFEMAASAIHLKTFLASFRFFIFYNCGRNQFFRSELRVSLEE